MMLGLGGLCAAGGAVIGTGALTSVEAERTVDIDVAGDSNAFVGLSATSSDSFVDTNGSALRIQLDGDVTGASGTGVNHGTSGGKVATTTLDPAFTISNQGPDTMYVRVDHTGTTASGNDAQFIADDQASNSGDSDADQTSNDVIDNNTVSPPVAFIDREGTSSNAVTTTVHSGGTTTAIGDGGYLQMESGEEVDVILQVASDGTSTGELINKATIEAYSAESASALSSPTLVPTV
jgi:hypothetical protein